MDMRIISKFENGTPKVFRRIKEPGKSGYKDLAVHPDKWRRVIINRLYESYIIFPPEGIAISQCGIYVRSKVQFFVVCYVEDNENGYWLIEFPTSKSLFSLSPATVNITLQPNDNENL